MKENPHFYSSLSSHTGSLRELLKNEELFSAIPKNWVIVVTDIVDSTKAIKNGQHNDVNLIATGCIITVLNKIKGIDNTLTIPYFFGGDGATFIVPPIIEKDIFSALEDYRIHVEKDMNLILRVGKMQVDKVYQDDFIIKMAKLKLNELLETPVVLGNGLKFAEQQIKKKFKIPEKSVNQNIVLDLTGMECRWDEILPSSSEKKVVCLLVMCSEEDKHAQTYSRIMDEIDYIFGALNQRTPITMLKLKLDASVKKIRKEMFARLGKKDTPYLIQNWVITNFGRYYFRFFKEGKKYLYKVTQLSDTVRLDGSVSTVFSGNQKQITQLKLILDALENDKKIVYGMHTTYASIMSCYIEDREDKHIHFVDGTEGGYTSASEILKNKLSNLRTYFWN